MKKIISILFSYKTALFLLSFFAISIAVATFVEDKYDISTAKTLVYNSKWMELLLFLLVVNFVGIIFKRKLYRKEKIVIFLFHLGFIVMIIGAAATRYVGYEGTMHIREGQSSNIIYTSDLYLQVSTSGMDPKSVENFEIDKTDKSNPFSYSFTHKEKGQVEISSKEYIFNATEKIIENSPDGTDMVEVRVATSAGNMSDVIKEGEVKQVGGLTVSFNNNSQANAVQLIRTNEKLQIVSSVDMYMSAQGKIIEDTIMAGVPEELHINKVYNVNEKLFLFAKHYVKAKKHIVSGNSASADAIIAEVKYKGQNHEVTIFGGEGYIVNAREYKIDDLSLKVGYGNIPFELPFSIFLKDFILERYPGSNSPSSFESTVVLTDTRTNINKDYNIYMNNILDHDGYRFFQSSYDKDEKGTVLSVNHDMLGAIITYFSYLLLCIGFIATFFVKQSRFSILRKRIRKTRAERKAIITTIALIIVFSTSGVSQSQKSVNQKHAEKFGKLIVQTYDGRFQPVHTLAYDVIHKISKKNSIYTEEKGNLSGMQLYLDFITDNEFWKTKNIIYVKEPSIRSFIGISGPYAKYNDFFDNTGKYKLYEFSEAAYKKNKAEKNKFDNEIIKVNERLNILLMTFRGSMLKIFPAQNSRNNKWLCLEDTAAYIPLTGSINIINEDLQLKPLTYSNMFQFYLQHLHEAIQINNYNRADQLLGYIDNIQRQSDLDKILPSESQINLEIHYNKARIFVMLKYVYMILSVVMLILAFADHLRAKKAKLLTLALNFSIVLLGFAFLYHTYGLILRWYLSGHAPWSNGYEALVFVAWGGLLAGFSFMRYSKITLSATALLAFFIMLTAGFSNYDPQLTNLQPVLKSYWLIIHVAVIVISYGFLGLGFVLGLINLFVYTFKNNKNFKRLDDIIKDLTNINEMNLIIGIVLATIGTFLGAVWANESWGRYWGWDAKETWALIILMVYAVVLHFRFVPSLNKPFVFNAASVVAFGSVLMTFFGVNYYFSKGLHSYASGDKAVFPLWAWIAILSIIILIIVAWLKHNKFKEKK